MTYPKGSLNLAQIKDAIYNWIKSETSGVLDDGHIIWRNQSEPLPGRPCVAMKITDGPRRVGFTDSLTSIPGNKFNLGGQREMTVSIQVFGNTKTHRPMAYQLALDLNSSLSKVTVLDALRAGGLGVQKQGDPINITELEESEYEERAQFDILFGVAQNIVDDPGIIEKVNATGDIDDHSVDIDVDGS